MVRLLPVGNEALQVPAATRLMPRCASRSSSTIDFLPHKRGIGTAESY